MTVAELIAILQTAPQDLLVVARGYEDGYDPINGAKKIEVVLCKDRAWYNGQYQDPDDTEGEKIAAVYLR